MATDGTRPPSDEELDARIQGSIARILARVDRNRTRHERQRQATDPTTTTDRTTAIIPDPEDA